MNGDYLARKISVARYIEQWSSDKLAWSWEALPREYRPVETKDRGDKFMHRFQDGSRGYIFKRSARYHALS